MSGELGSNGIQDVSWSGGFSLGGGFDTMSSTAHSSCLELGGAVPAPTNHGQTTTLALEVVESSASLAKSLNMSASASAEFGAYKGDAKASFAASRACNSSSLFVVASVNVQDHTAQYSGDAQHAFKMTPKAATLWSKNPWAFRDTYGTHFVSGAAYGGQLYCVVSIQTNSTEDKLALAVSASGAGNGIEGKADFSAKLDALTKGRSIQVWIHKNGGEPVQLKNEDMTIAHFIDMVGGFPTEVAKAPKELDAILVPFAELASVPPKTLDLQLKELQIGALVDKYLQYRDALGDLDYLGLHREEFVYPPIKDDQIRRVRALLTEKQQQIVQAVTDLTTKEDAQPAQFASPWEVSGDLPVRRTKLPSSAADIHQMYPDAPDGEYDLYLGGKLTGHVKLYCHNLKTSPAEFLTLHSPDNYSEWPASQSAGQRWRHGTTIRTTYARIRISGYSGIVITSDRTFATTTGGPLTDTDASGRTGATFEGADFATASASNHDLNAAHQSREPFGSAKVDLVGTGLRFADGTAWQLGGFDPRTNKPLTPNGGMQQMTVTAGGAPASCAPIALMLVAM